MLRNIILLPKLTNFLIARCLNLYTLVLWCDSLFLYTKLLTLLLSIWMISSSLLLRFSLSFLYIHTHSFIIWMFDFGLIMLFIFIHQQFSSYWEFILLLIPIMSLSPNLMIQSHYKLYSRYGILLMIRK